MRITSDHRRTLARRSHRRTGRDLPQAPDPLPLRLSPSLRSPPNRQRWLCLVRSEARPRLYPRHQQARSVLPLLPISPRSCSADSCGMRRQTLFPVFPDEHLGSPSLMERCSFERTTCTSLALEGRTRTVPSIRLSLSRSSAIMQGQSVPCLLSHPPIAGADLRFFDT